MCAAEKIPDPVYRADMLISGWIRLRLFYPWVLAHPWLDGDGETARMIGRIIAKVATHAEHLKVEGVAAEI